MLVLLCDSVSLSSWRRPNDAQSPFRNIYSRLISIKHKLELQPRTESRPPPELDTMSSLQWPHKLLIWSLEGNLYTQQVTILQNKEHTQS